jgi:undecaprenyl-diphosphatase
MNDLLAALLLGIIEGITEFLPVSSTGHLLIAEHWLGTRSELFNIAIQAGAILAVVLIYWKRLWGMLLAFAGKDAPAAFDPLGQNATPAQSRDYAFKLLAAFGVTAVLGLLVKKLGWTLPDDIRPVAWALILGAGWMLLAEWWAARRTAQVGERTTITWKVAILVGLAQVVAGVFPGTSRSAATIFIALLAGTTSRAAATEFAFLVGIPTMFAATGYELLKLFTHGGGAAGEHWLALGVACVVSAITAFVAVKWLLHYIQTHRFTAFAVYRLVIGVALLLWLPSGV